MQNVKTSKTDVLIIGAGPSGYMAACWFARTGVPFRIIDKRSNKVFAGQADGLQARTLEVFQSFGFGDRALKEANPINEMCFWSPNNLGELKRTAREYDSIPGLSRFSEMVLNQGRIEQWFVDSIDKWSGKKVDRSILPLKIDVDESKEYPVSVLVKDISQSNGEREKQDGIANGLFRQFEGDQEKFYDNLTEAEAEELEIIQCKYLIGSDGAHSWVRKECEIHMEGETTDHVWGVVDMVPATDFPDIRNRCAIHSKDSGSIMVIPRENGLVRLYAQLKDMVPDAEKKRADRSKITPELILQTARNILKPYTMDFVDVSWYTGYQIGQRVSDRFSHKDRIFITGDACHTHSPKAGQGMNVSMMDTYNLAWKLAYVCKNLASSDILKTYETERIKVARDLIEFDKKLSKLFSSAPMIPGAVGGVDMEEFQDAFKTGLHFASGLKVQYESLLVGKNALNASRIFVGQRFPTTLVTLQADASVHELADRMLSDGRWRVIAFCGDVNQMNTKTALSDIGAYFDSEDSFIRKFTPASALPDSVFEILTIHNNERHSVELADFPEFCRPRDHKKRMDYWKLFCGQEDTYHRGKCDAYAYYGIHSGLVLVRPDGYVACSTGFNVEGLKQMGKFLGTFMLSSESVLNPEYREVDRRNEPLLAV